MAPRRNYQHEHNHSNIFSGVYFGKLVVLQICSLNPVIKDGSGISAGEHLIWATFRKRLRCIRCKIKGTKRTLSNELVPKGSCRMQQRQPGRWDRRRDTRKMEHAKGIQYGDREETPQHCDYGVISSVSHVSYSVVLVSNKGAYTRSQKL